MDQTSSSSTSSSNDSSLHPLPSLDDSGGKSTPIRTPSRSSSSVDDNDINAARVVLDDVSKLRKPPQAHREEQRGPPGSRRNTDRPNESDDEDDDSGDAEDDALVLDQDPAEMSSWSGQPSIRGSSEAVRMILLTFSTIGIT